MYARLAWTSIAALAFALATSIAHAQSGSAAGGAGTSANRGAERPQRASRIIGMDIVNRQGEKIGDIEDLVLDRQGNVAWAVVSTGAFLGVGERLHAVPWKSLQAGSGADSFVLDIDRERLRGAPGFDQNSFPDLNDPRWSAENRRHFAATASSTVGRDTSPPNADRARGSGTSTGRGPGTDIGPSATRSGRSGNAAGTSQRNPAGPGGTGVADTPAPPASDAVSGSGTPAPEVQSGNRARAIK